MQAISRRVLGKVLLLLLAGAAGACGTSAIAQKAIAVSATPTPQVGYTNLSIKVTITPWLSTDSGRIVLSVNGQPFQAINVPNSSGGTIQTTIKNIYPRQHTLTAKYKGIKGVVSVGSTSGKYGNISFAVPLAGSDYLGAWVDGNDVIGPVNLDNLQSGDNTGIGRPVAVHLEYIGWTNNTSQLWIDLSSTNPAPVKRLYILNPGMGYVAPPQAQIIAVGSINVTPSNEFITMHF